VFQVCDRLAAAGLHVCAPDTFRGRPWSKDKFPPKPEDDFMGWVSSEGGFDKVSKDIGQVGGGGSTGSRVVLAQRPGAGGGELRPRARHPAWTRPTAASQRCFQQGVGVPGSVVTEHGLNSPPEPVLALSLMLPLADAATCLASRGSAHAPSSSHPHAPYPHSFLPQAVDHLRSQGCKSFGVIGFCWGVAIATQAAADPTFRAAGGCRWWRHCL
jgi:hypothetical protein